MNEFNAPQIAILIGILVVMITIAGLYFHKNFKIVKRIEDKASCNPIHSSPDLIENPVDAKEVPDTQAAASSSGERPARVPFEGYVPLDENEEVPPVRIKTRLVYCGNNVDRLSLRMVKCKCAANLAHIIDKRIKGHKVHVWPGCKKVSTRHDAAMLDIRRYN